MNWATHAPRHCRCSKFVVESLLVCLAIASRRGKVNGLSVLECTGGCFGNKNGRCELFHAVFFSVDAKLPGFVMPR